MKWQPRRKPSPNRKNLHLAVIQVTMVHITSLFFKKTIKLECLQKATVKEEKLEHRRKLHL